MERCATDTDLNLGVVELSIEDLAERWSWLLWECGIESLYVEEYFHKCENVSYVVNGLTMEFENEYAYCWDVNKILLKNCSVLTLFLKNSLKSIHLLPVLSGMQERLEFDNGIILIERVL
jgi:hypothetical protein